MKISKVTNYAALSIPFKKGEGGGANTILYKVKPVLSDHLKTDKTKVLMENGSLMEVESIAECSPWSILQYF